MTAIQEALEADRPEMFALLSQLVRTPSLGGSEHEVSIQHTLANLLQTEGLEVDLWPLDLNALADHPDFPGVEVDRREAWGLVARLPGRGGSPTLMLNAHVDVVPAGDVAAWTQGAPFSGEIANGRLYGRGACDMKGGLVAAWWALRALRRAQVALKGDLLFATVIGEEDGGLGTFGLLHRGWRADACVIPEPTGLALVPATAGALTFRLRVRGHATHASRRTEGVSALERFWPVWSALHQLEKTRNADVGPLMH
ncbi:MAG: M20/M25/M40 family metallo-hydrolase, partial [Chloroflexota bacterium]|nr:M20/M25/M40 family metallo-hydrolase [Chloroflexota bacterium]